MLVLPTSAGSGGNPEWMCKEQMKSWVSRECLTRVQGWQGPQCLGPWEWQSLPKLRLLDDKVLLYFWMQMLIVCVNTSVYKWLASVCKACNCSFLFLDNCSPRLPHRDWRLASPPLLLAAGYWCTNGAALREQAWSTVQELFCLYICPSFIPSLPRSARLSKTKPFRM